MSRMPVSPLVARGLELAEKRLGILELSVRLGSPAESIKAWRLGHATMPERKFMVLVEMLTELDPGWNR